MEVMYGSTSVSYTHLDVYKRQALTIAFKLRVTIYKPHICIIWGVNKLIPAI